MIDLWHIAPGLDTPEHLRARIAQFVCEIASEAALKAHIRPQEHGLGFICLSPPEPIPDSARALLVLLQSLDSPLLIGRPDSTVRRLSDDGLVKLFRLLRLARRLRDIEAGSEPGC